MKTTRSFRLVNSLIDITVGVAVILLGLRFIMRLFGASIEAPFVQWTYETTITLLSPFRGIFEQRSLEGGLFVLEFNTLFAIIIYVIFGYLLQWLVSIIGESASKK